MNHKKLFNYLFSFIILVLIVPQIFIEKNNFNVFILDNTLLKLAIENKKNEMRLINLPKECMSTIKKTGYAEFDKLEKDQFLTELKHIKLILPHTLEISTQKRHKAFHYYLGQEFKQVKYFRLKEKILAYYQSKKIKKKPNNILKTSPLLSLKAKDIAILLYNLEASELKLISFDDNDQINLIKEKVMFEVLQKIKHIKINPSYLVELLNETKYDHPIDLFTILDAKLLSQLAKHESNLSIFAVSHTAAYGLFQATDQFSYSSKNKPHFNPFRIKGSILGMLEHFKVEVFNQFPSWWNQQSSSSETKSIALDVYNKGMIAVKKLIKKHGFKNYKKLIQSQENYYFTKNNNPANFSFKVQNSN